MVSSDGRRSEEGLQRTLNNSGSDRVEQVRQKACLPNSGPKRSGCWRPWRDEILHNAGFKARVLAGGLDEESTKLTTFMTPWGAYRFKRNVMRLISAGDEHNRRGDEALKGIENVVKIIARNF